jgi:phage terminase large subunit-like protein
LAEFAGTEFEQQERFGVFMSQAKVFGGIDFSEPPIRVSVLPQDFSKVAVWVDPATSSAVHSCEVGIVVVAIDSAGHIYALDDFSAVMGAEHWPAVVLDAVERWAPCGPVSVGIEINKGGNMGPELVRSAEKIRKLQGGLPGLSTLDIRTATATQSKAQRASPLVRLFRSGYLHLPHGLTALERQLRELDDGEGPKRDRADAFVWGVLDMTAAESTDSDDDSGIIHIPSRYAGMRGGEHSGRFNLREHSAYGRRY